MSRLLFLILSILATSSNGSRILGLFPHPGRTHFDVFYPIMKALVDAGHEVTVVSQFPLKEPIENYKDEVLISEDSGLLNAVDTSLFKNAPSYQHLMEFFLLKEWGLQSCELVLNSSALRNVLSQGRREPFDLIIVELFNNDCMLGVAHKLNAPVIALSSCNIMPWHFTQLGLPYEPGFYPTTFIQASDDMTFGTRLSNWFTLVYTNFMFQRITQRKTNELLRRRFGKDFPDVRHMIKKVSLTFVNQHFSLSGAKHLSPNVIELGGVHIGKMKELDKELQELLDTAEHGVIYISWGSMVRTDTLSEEKRDGILRALGKFKQRVLWKMENETMPNQPSNVFIRKWMPQREILCHPNVRVFMTHGGLLGSSEAAYCGVPVVSTPFYGDQFLNSAAMEKRGMGVILKFDDITESTVHNAVRRVLDVKYKANAKKVSYSYTHRPMTPKQTAVFWAEYVMATKGADLVKPHTVYAHWIVYSGLDIFLFVTLSLLSFIALVVHLLRKVFTSSNASKNSRAQGVAVERKNQ